MKMNVVWRQLSMLVMVLLLGLPTLSQAGNRSGAFTLSPMVGGQVFNSSEDFQDAAFLGLNLGYNVTKHWGVELAGTTANVDNELAGAGDFNYWSGGIDLLYHFRPDRNLVPYIVLGGGDTFLENKGAGNSFNVDPFVNYGVGIKYFLNDWLALRLDTRHLIRHEMGGELTASGKYYNNFVFSGGLTFQLGGQKTVATKQLVVEKEEVVVSHDSDNDGVVDAIDQCSETPAGAKVDAQGCRQVVKAVVVVDTDADGVVDGKDKCPNTPAGVQVNAQGCLADSDTDGVVDGKDDCPNTLSGIAVNSRGCPRDSDHDGVFDADDHCPNTVAGKLVSADGCEIVPPAPEQLRLEITFDSNSSVIAPQFNDQLQKAADFIKAHPGKKILVEGYTDSTGPAGVNQQLSQKRADTVRWVLFRDYGVDRLRLKARGFGEENPIADNATLQGRKINRRVVVKIVD